MRVGVLQQVRALAERMEMAVLIPGLGDAGGVQQELLAEGELHLIGLGPSLPCAPSPSGRA
ncbi:hypothetical protein GCM10023080_026600 [Streptomyces pseudoechinosporeus]